MLALHAVLTLQRLPVAALLTTVTADYDRVSMHGVRRTLLEQQAAALGLPLHLVALSASSSDEEYRTRMAEALIGFRDRGIRAVVHGDIFLEDVRRYREALLATLGMKALFPLWQLDPAHVARRFLRLGYRAVLTCVDTSTLDAGFAGRDYDASLLRDLPRDVDLCGERGEFHTFVYDGPLFSRRVAYLRGPTVLRDGRFAFHDLLPTSGAAAKTP